MEYTIESFKNITSRCYERFVDSVATPRDAALTLLGFLTWPDDVPMVKGLKALGIIDYSDEELLCLLMFFDDYFYDGLIPLQYRRFSKNKHFSDILKGIDGLLKRGVLRYEGASSDSPVKNEDRKAQYIITPWALKKLFQGEVATSSYGDIVKQTEIIPAGSIQEKQLFYNEQNRRDTERLFHLLQPSQLSGIMERLESKGRRAAATILLYGAPGTGKTELAKQLARATGRDLIISDVSKLTSSWHGDTEKNYREMFTAYKYLQSVSSVMPILLLNEADALLSKRGDALRQAIDKMENRVQNLLLQEMEDFEGIMIATTNLAENLDRAFERRFLYKMQLSLPDLDTRTRIWQSEMPDLGLEAARTLALNYMFSGGQIDNVAMRCDIESALLGRDLSFKEILSLCEGEQVDYSSQQDQMIINHPIVGGGILS